MSPNQTPAWHALSAHQQTMRTVHLRDLFAADAARGTRFALDAGPLHLDYSKHRITNQTVTLLLDLARARDVEG